LDNEFKNLLIGSKVDSLAREHITSAQSIKADALTTSYFDLLNHLYDYTLHFLSLLQSCLLFS